MRGLIKRWFGLVEPDEAVLVQGTKIRVNLFGFDTWLRVDQITVTRDMYETTVTVSLVEQE